MTDLRKRIPNVYYWLYRHDLQWLNEHKPSLRVKQTPRNNRVNWPARDTLLAKLVIRASERLYMLEPPMFVSQTALAREAGCLALIEQHIEQLPLTKDTLRQYSENREEYAIQRIHYKTKNFQERKLMPTGWQLIRAAGVDRLSKSPQIQSEIQLALRKLNGEAGFDQSDDHEADM